jgi:hypothetical protein
VLVFETYSKKSWGNSVITQVASFTCNVVAFFAGTSFIFGFYVLLCLTFTGEPETLSTFDAWPRLHECVSLNLLLKMGGIYDYEVILRTKGFSAPIRKVLGFPILIDGQIINGRRMLLTILLLGGSL